MADEYSTPLDMLMPPSEPDKCQPYPSITPQQTNGACRGQEVMDRTYEVPQPSSFNFATDARPSPPGTAGQQQGDSPPQGGKIEDFGMPGILKSLQNIQAKEYFLLAVVIYMALMPEAGVIVTSYAPSGLTDDRSRIPLIVAMLATIIFYVAREYFVYM